MMPRHACARWCPNRAVSWDDSGSDAELAAQPGVKVEEFAVLRLAPIVIVCPEDRDAAQGTPRFRVEEFLERF
jgi:hypothetical protein